MAFWVRQSKDRTFVVNVVSWYRQVLDRVLAACGSAHAAAVRASSGQSRSGFEPDPSKTFNRGFTTYFLGGRGEPPGAIDSPKMVGEFVGTVTATQGQSFVLDTVLLLHSGDGLCWFDEQHELGGTVVNAARPIAEGMVITG
jgi:hypothetical protein